MFRALAITALLAFYCCICNAQHEANVAVKKITAPLKGALQQAKGTEQLAVFLNFSDGQLPGKDSKVLARHARSNVYLVRINKEDLIKVMATNKVTFADLYVQPKEELTTGSLDLATNKANYAHSMFPAIDGDGILISIKENSFDTTDIDYLNRHKGTVLPSPIVTAHASIMATTI
ncbi:MAG TPA: hypothetical protein VEY06_06375, partial [Flavisolibacter sp.]|nr:hypothetical protein [Flavisolibacter sp.]